MTAPRTALVVTLALLLAGSPSSRAQTSEAPSPPDPADAPAEPALPAEPAETRTTVPAWTWAVLGAGVTMAATGVGVHVWAASLHDDLLRDHPDGTPTKPAPSANQVAYDRGFDADVQPRLQAAYALYAIGGAAVITGLVLMVATAEEVAVEPEDELESALTPWIGPGGAGVSWQGSF